MAGLQTDLYKYMREKSRQHYYHQGGRELKQIKYYLKRLNWDKEDVGHLNTLHEQLKYVKMKYLEEKLLHLK